MEPDADAACFEAGRIKVDLAKEDSNRPYVAEAD
jgi:hypothetical protein